jgi:hypothetical protein
MNKTELDFETFPYELTENEHTVTIEMPKGIFTSIMRVTKLGNDCIKFRCLPDKMPGRGKGTSSAITGLCYDAFRISKKAYEERTKNKTND